MKLFSILISYQNSRSVRQHRTILFAKRANLVNHILGSVWFIFVTNSVGPGHHQLHLSRWAGPSNLIWKIPCTTVSVFRIHRTAKDRRVKYSICCNILPRDVQEVRYAFCIRNPPCFEILPDLKSSLIWYPPWLNKQLGAAEYPGNISLLKQLPELVVKKAEDP